MDSGASIQTQGDFRNSGQVYVGYNNATGGSSLTIGGTLTNTNYLLIGNTNQTGLSSTVSAANLVVGGGNITLYGGTGTSTNQATLDITSGTAPSVLAGSLTLSGHALVEFAGGQITSIGPQGGITLNGGSAFVADAADTGSNSALIGLANNAGTLELDNGATLQTQGDFTNSGTLNVDTGSYYTTGGASLTIGGTLTNTGRLTIGSYYQTTSGSTVSAVDLANAGYITLNGGTGTTANQATLDIISGTAPSVLAGHLNLSGHALVEFAGGQITDIAATGGLTLIGGTAFVADAGNTSANSALNLASNAGSLDIEGGVTLPTPGNFPNTGSASVNVSNYNNSGTALSIGGTLTNSTISVSATTTGPPRRRSARPPWSIPAPAGSMSPATTMAARDADDPSTSPGRPSAARYR